MMAKRSSRDLLSDLPLGIIHKILALVPIKDAVKTSILSRKWRFKWASLPELVFDYECVGSEEDDTETRLKHIIHQTLLLHEGPIQKFKLVVPYIGRCSYTDQWLLFLSRNGVRMLILDVGGDMDGYFQVHSSLYYCQNLTHLELKDCAIPLPPPTFTGFLRLRCLVLEFVEMPSDTIEGLVANSPLLEILMLYENKLGCKLKISAPNLKSFYFSGICTEICLYSPLLAKLRVCIIDNKFPAEVCNYTAFLGGLSNLKELSGNLSFIKYLSIGVESCQRFLVFNHLRLIEIDSMNRADMKLISSFLTRLMRDAPNLHKLIIPCCEYASEATTISSQDFEFALNLKVIEMRNVCGRFHDMRLIKFLLAISPVLERMILKPHSYLTGKQIINMTAELLRFCRASTKAEILFIKRPRFCRASTKDDLEAISSLHR